MSDVETIAVPHLGGSTIGYRFGKPHDASLPTLVMVNSFTTSAALYRPQFADERLTGAANLLALEPYGHGQTRAGVRAVHLLGLGPGQPAGPRRARHL